ncbi:hypothetical protein [Nostoc sp. WHI]|uniref:hypothetical protein n=1 Tax=Nostoc sp. WHI TaxID=2650611 RepID=UPI001E433C04|nr:hypothetical protein [Nostoc sp. WHI]MBG1270595.1 hypothetical protein [Nostoc sp. WHI]
MPQLPNFRDWRWWFNLAKANPLILVFAVALVSITASQLKREFTDCQQTNQMLSCLFFEKSPMP